MSNLASYRTLVADVPRPTHQQMEAFAVFVCRAHSWYKHLPVIPPGFPFQFFVDPCAGMQLVSRSMTDFDVEVREETGFHYSQLPTAEYRERFGHLAYSRTAGTSVIRPRSDGVLEVPSDDDPLVFSERAGSLVRLPAEVLEAGRVEVTGAVHPRQLPGCWLIQARRSKTELTWPEESGGLEALHDILECCRALATQARGGSSFRHQERALLALMDPERRRQQREMVAAMERVLELVQGPRVHAAGS